jgi:carbon storage regulator
MLVLSRKKNETLVIREDIVLTIIEIRGDKVRLGIEAPDDVHVLRGELVGQEPKANTAPATPPTH